MQVRIMDQTPDNKLFIGMLPKTFIEENLYNVFIQYGDLREVHIIRGPEGASKGCAFIKFVEQDAALLAIEYMHDVVPVVRILTYLLIITITNCLYVYYQQ